MSVFPTFLAFDASGRQVSLIVTMETQPIALSYGSTLDTFDASQLLISVSENHTAATKEDLMCLHTRRTNCPCLKCLEVSTGGFKYHSE